MIKQNHLRQIVKLRREIENLEQELKIRKAALSDAESKILQRLLNGDGNEEGKYIPEVQTVLKRASISWKSVVEELKGKLYVEKILQEAPRKEIKKLVIKERV